MDALMGGGIEEEERGKKDEEEAISIITLSVNGVSLFQTEGYEW